MNGMNRVSGLVVIIALTTCAAGGALQPKQLECEYRASPLGIDTLTPRLSWMLQTDRKTERGQRQTAYHILVASSEQLLRPGEADLWDSGRSASDQSRLIPYAGKPLVARQRCYWKVRVWDVNGKASAWSSPASWTMGLLHLEDWKPAQWIGEVREVQSGLSNCVWVWTSESSANGKFPAGQRYFRKRFSIPGDTKVARARAVMTADNSFTLFINGKAALTGDKWESAFEGEVQSLLLVGENALAVEVSNAGSTPSEAGLIGKLEIQLADGHKLAVPVDDSWKANDHAPAGWQAAAFDDASWSGARLLGEYGMPPWGKVSEAALPPPVFRREFEVAKPIRRATAFVSGLGHYELRFNGQRVGDHVIDPGWTDYRDTCLYSTYDVTQLLARGQNAIGVLLGNGMFNVVGGRYVKFRGSFGLPKLILQLHVEYADGTRMVIGTDQHWRTTTGPITFSCTYGGEDYDARLEMPGWDRARFDDHNWQPAQMVAGPGGALRSQSCSPIKVMEEFTPVKITEPKPGVFVYDLGQNISGWPKLTVRGSAGATVKMIPGELLADTGLVSQRSSGGPVSFSYTLRGDGEETWSPRFSYYGFRYVQIEGAQPDAMKESPGLKPALAATKSLNRSQTSVPSASQTPRIMELRSQWLHNSAPVVGDFECSNPLINRIHKLILAAIRCNLQSVLTDCPHREKLGWLEVSHLLGRGIMFNYRTPGFYAKVSQDMRESQLENGLVPDIAPEYTVFSGGFRDSPEWGSAALFNPWLVREFYGDASLLAQHYDVMQRYVAYLGSRASDHIVAHGLGDWYDIGPRDPGPSQLTSIGLTATAIYYGDLMILADTARRLGKADDAARYDQLAAQVRTAFNARFFHLDSRRYDTGSQTAQAMPLVLGLVATEHRAAVIENLVQSVRTNGNRVTAGDVGFMYVVRALTDAGRSDVLFDMVTQTNGPGYAEQLRKGATTLTEAWDANPNSSHNHCMLGHAEEWFYTGLAGIRPDPAAPGFKRFLIQPAIVGDLTWVKAHHDSPHGRIASAWERDGRKLTLEVQIPPNTTATIHVPATDAAIVREGGKLATKVPGLTLLRTESGQTVFAAGSGHYRFSSELPAW